MKMELMTPTMRRHVIRVYHSGCAERWLFGLVKRAYNSTWADIVICLTGGTIRDRIEYDDIQAWLRKYPRKTY